jgi:hypothetical protein
MAYPTALPRKAYSRQRPGSSCRLRANSAPTGSEFAGAAAPMHASCGTTRPHLDTAKENVVDPARDGAANQRSGSSTSCAVLGVLQPTDNADCHCYTWQDDGVHSWTYLRNIRTGVRGRVRNVLLGDNGSYVSCD